MINEEKLINLLFEGNESLVVKNGERFHLEDYIEYFNKPGLIVATIKGDSELGVQQLPIGAVDSFRFMQITNEDAIINQAKNNGKSYDQILKEYENEKCGILNQWKKMNSDKLNGLMNKYGNRFLGMDIVENKKKIEPKDEKEIKTDDKKEIKSEPTPEQPSETSEITEDEIIDEGVWQNIKDKFSSMASTIGKNLKDAYDSTISGLKNTINSPFTQKSVKILSKVLSKLDDDIDESKIYMYCDFNGKTSTINGTKVLTINNRKYICIFFKDKVASTITLKQFGDELEKNIESNMTRDISGIISFTDTMKHFFESPSSTSKEGTLTEADKNITQEDSYRPIIDIRMENNKITFVIGKSNIEKKQEKRRRNIYK
jgi:hypothetical protein